MARVHISCDLTALQNNYLAFVKKYPTAKMASVVKADAYGIGALNAVQALYDVGCRYFFVATLEEAQITREVALNTKIYVLEGIKPNEIQAFHNSYLTPIINSPQELHAIAGSYLPCMLHIDTGMNRLGMSIQEAVDAVQTYAPPALDIVGVMMHFACSDERSHPMNHQQIQTAKEIKKLFPKKIHSFANSYAAFHFPNMPKNMVRLGVALYGGIEDDFLKPVIQLEGEILQKRTIQVGETVGYGAGYVATMPKRLITVAGGYADGLPRSLSDSGYCAFYQGERIALVGRVSMDSCIFDVSHIPDENISVGDKIQFFGHDISLSEVAKYAKTIPYEILVHLSRRAIWNFIT